MDLKLWHCPMSGVIVINCYIIVRGLLQSYLFQLAFLISLVFLNSVASLLMFQERSGTQAFGAYYSSVMLN